VPLNPNHPLVPWHSADWDAGCCIHYMCAFSCLYDCCYLVDCSIRELEIKLRKTTGK